MDVWPQSYFGFGGRLGLRAFWTRILIALLCGLSIFLLPALLPQPVSNAAWLVTIVAAGWCQASLTWRRLNDLDYGVRAKLLLTVVPASGLALVAVLFDVVAGWVPAWEDTALGVGVGVLLLISPFWLWATIMLYTRPGTKDANRYGVAAE